MSVSAVNGIIWAAIAIAVSILWYRRATLDSEARKDEHQAQQLLTLKQQLGLTGEPVAVKASSGLIVPVLSICLFIFHGYLAFTSPSVGSMGVFAITALAAALVGCIFLPRVGKPALTIRPDGLAMPVYGFLRWDEIESIGLQRYTPNGATTYSLDLYVPQLRDRERRMHPLLGVVWRFLPRRSSPNFIVVHLACPSLPATLVHALCHDLWKERTGKTRSWTSVLPEHRIEQMRRADERLEMLKRVAAETDPAEALKLLDDIDRRFGDPSVERKPKKHLSAVAIARRDALLADLRTVGARDPVATKRLLEKHANAYAREMTAKLASFGVTLAVLVVAALVLFRE